MGSVDISSASSSSVSLTVYSDSACTTSPTTVTDTTGSCQSLGGSSSLKLTYSHAILYNFSIFAISFLLLSFIIWSE